MVGVLVLDRSRFRVLPPRLRALLMPAMTSSSDGDSRLGARDAMDRSAQAAGVRPAPINGPCFPVSGPMSGSSGVDLIGPRPCSSGARQGKSFPTFARTPRGRPVCLARID